jgi:hypothetical protein
MVYNLGMPTYLISSPAIAIVNFEADTPRRGNRLLEAMAKGEARAGEATRRGEGVRPQNPAVDLG